MEAADVTVSETVADSTVQPLCDAFSNNFGYTESSM
jgi:hypothetical protein